MIHLPPGRSPTIPHSANKSSRTFLSTPWPHSLYRRYNFLPSSPSSDSLATPPLHSLLALSAILCKACSERLCKHRSQLLPSISACDPSLRGVPPQRLSTSSFFPHPIYSVIIISKHHNPHNASLTSTSYTPSTILYRRRSRSHYPFLTPVDPINSKLLHLWPSLPLIRSDRYESGGTPFSGRLVSSRLVSSVVVDCSHL